MELQAAYPSSPPPRPQRRLFWMTGLVGPLSSSQPPMCGCLSKCPQQRMVCSLCPSTSTYSSGESPSSFMSSDLSPLMLSPSTQLWMCLPAFSSSPLVSHSGSQKRLVLGMAINSCREGTQSFQKWFSMKVLIESLSKFIIIANDMVNLSRQKSKQSPCAFGSISLWLSLQVGWRRQNFTPLIISNYLAITFQLEDHVQMHRPHTSSQPEHLPSPTSPRLRSLFSPQDGQNRKKTMRRAVIAQQRGNSQEKERDGLLQGEQAGRRPNGSLRKHEHFGKIHQLPPSPTPAETLTSHSNSKGQRAIQRPKASSKQKREGKGTGLSKGGESREAIQGRENSSQYYQTLKMGISQQRSREIHKWQRKQHELQGTGLKKIEEVTFSMDSTEPENDDKQHTNDYQLPTRTPRVRQQDGQASDGQFLTAFRKKIIEKEIAEKEKIYRGFIRSSSREANPHEKTRLKSKMKDVLDDLYQLKKLVRS